MSGKNYIKLDLELLAVLAGVEHLAFVLAVLLLYRHRYLAHGTPWPTDTAMAKQIGFDRWKFSVHVKALREKGIITVERSLDEHGRMRSIYSFNIPCLPVPEKADAKEEHKEEHTEPAVEEIAPVLLEAGIKRLPIKLREPCRNNMIASDVCWTNFIKRCPMDLGPYAVEREFKAMPQAYQVFAAHFVWEYGQIYLSAKRERRRYFPSMQKWIGDREFLKSDEFWRQRAGFSLRASGGVPDGVNYAEILEAKIQDI